MLWKLNISSWLCGQFGPSVNLLFTFIVVMTCSYWFKNTNPVRCPLESSTFCWGFVGSRKRFLWCYSLLFTRVLNMKLYSFICSVNFFLVIFLTSNLLPIFQLSLLFTGQEFWSIIKADWFDRVCWRRDVSYPNGMDESSDRKLEHCQTVSCL